VISIVDGNEIGLGQPMRLETKARALAPLEQFI
jgi:hypothetical protein